MVMPNEYRCEECQMPKGGADVVRLQGGGWMHRSPCWLNALSAVLTRDSN